MNVLIIEDHVFNAFCLRNLLESIIPFVKITLIKSASEAMVHAAHCTPDLIIVDGDLNCPDGITGPYIAEFFLKRNSTLSIIAWSDSQGMQEAFTEVFARFGRVTNRFNVWPKAINMERVNASIEYYFGDITRISRQA